MRIRVTVGRLMVTTASIGFGLAAFRLHPSLGVFVGCVSCLMLARTFGTIDRCRAEGLPTPAGWVFGVVFTSTIVATLLLALPLFALCLISCILGPPLGSHPSPGEYIPVMVVGLPVTAFLAYRLRRDLWPYEKTNSSPQGWASFHPGVVGEDSEG